MERTPLIQLKELVKVFTLGGEQIYALNHLSLNINKGEMVGILGTSGSGKSTLLNIMAGLEKPTAGEIIYGHLHLEKLNEKELTKFRQLNVGFVFQSYNLLPTLTALENVGLGLMFKGVSKKEREEESKRMLSLVGLEKRMHHKPKQLSGGQQQRVSIARAFVGTPKIIFADEPTGNLDTATTYEIMELITGIAKRNQQTVIMVTHDEELSNFVDISYHMRDGEIIRISRKGGEA